MSTDLRIRANVANKNNIKKEETILPHPAPPTTTDACNTCTSTYASTRTLLRKREVHVTEFNTEAERLSIVHGYVVIFLCNFLSCITLALYMLSYMTARQELNWEVAFLLFKGACEMYQGKFSWALVLHHTAMIFGFWFNAHHSLQCFSWIVVHQQFVHFPFALRALWRLTLPSLGYIENEMSWRRRFVSNFFWMAWMFVVGYRTPLITFYGLWAAYAVNDQIQKPMVWQGLTTFGFGLIIFNLDRVWTYSMWPKKSKATMLHSFYFHFGARFMFLFGIFTATVIMFSNELELELRNPWYPDEYLLPSWARIRLAGVENVTTLECLRENNFALDPRVDRLNRFREFVGL